MSTLYAELSEKEKEKEKEKESDREQVRQTLELINAVLGGPG